MFESFWSKVEQDDGIANGFRTYVLDKMVSYSSDGAACMVGKYQSFWRELVKKLGREIPAIQCLAHKTQLSIRRAILKTTATIGDHFKTFEKSINKFYIFYMSRGSKRWQHLVDTATNLDVGKLRRIKYYFDVRWASSEYRALYAIKEDYLALVIDTKAISIDPSFTRAAQASALVINTLLLDKSWMATKYEASDYLSVHQRISLSFQTEPSSLVGKSKTVQQGKDSFDILAKKPGTFLAGFLSKCSCPGICEIGTCTLIQYESCPEVLYLGQKLIDSSESFKLSEVRSTLYASMIHELDHYFNLAELKAFNLFDQREGDLSLEAEDMIVLQANEKAPMQECEEPDKYEIQPVNISDIYEAAEHNFSAYSYEFPVHDNFVLVGNSSYFEEIRRGSILVEYSDNENFVILCKFFNIGSDECQLIYNDIVIVKHQILTTPYYVYNMKVEPVVFWPMVLKNRDGKLSITQRVIDFVEMILVIPFGTAVCERGFSYLTRVQDSGRTGTKPETLDNILRIIINGSKEINEFNALSIAKLYIKTFARVDDPTAMGGKAHSKSFKYNPRSRLF